MEAVQLAKFKHALKTQQAVALHDLRENRGIIAVERNADEMDQTGQFAERDVAILSLNRRSEQVSNIQAALRRIEDGTFGTYTNCDETIGQSRLVAVPWTPFCIRCQEIVDRGDRSNVEPDYEFDFNAV